MICQTCHKNAATIHVTEITEVDVEAPSGKTQPGEAQSGEKAEAAPARRKEVQEQHLCENCAQTMELPHMPAAKKTMADIWKLLQQSAQQTRKRGGPACPDCGMTLDEFRKKGRLGCARDYEVFKSHIGDLLERVHGARAHVGRVPGTSEADSLRTQRMTALKQQLDEAIRSEAYENAARLRDEIKALDPPSTG